VILKEVYKLWDLVLLKRSPADIQHSYLLLGLILALVIAGQWLAKEQSMPESSNYLWLAMVVILLILRTIPFLIFGRKERIVQSLTALFGSDLIITLPLLVALHVIDATQKSLILVLLFYFSYTWRFAVSIFVYKLALGINWIHAFVVVLVTAILNIIAVDQVSTILAHH
jgi:hypothetical protein